MSASEWSLRKSMAFLIASTCVTLTLALSSYFLWNHYKKKRLQDPAYRVVAIVQTGSEREALKTSYLAELLHLSVDRPISLYALDPKKCEEKLLCSPLIASAKVKRLPPGTLYIDYEVRKPIAWLSDYQNIAIDRKGYLFPVTPFFSPKNLPEIYLGLPAFGEMEDAQGRAGGSWQAPLQNRYLHLALELLQYLEGSPWKEGLRIKRIDVSNAFAPSLGQREVVLFTEEELSIRQKEREILCVFPKILRLSPKEYTQQLSHFLTLRRSMMEDYRRQLAGAKEGGQFAPRIIDLRIPQLAFIENHS